MAIKTVLDSLEGVPEGLHEFYAEADDKFILKVDGIDEHPDVSNLRNAYQRVKDSDKEARQQLQELKQKAESLPEDFDPKLWNQAKSGELTEGLVSVRKELESKVSTLEQQLAEREQSIRTMTVDRALGEALDAANITTPAYRKAATVLLRDAVKLDGDKVIVDSDMGPLAPTDYVKKWAASDEGKAFVSQPSGGGSKSGNPNVTKPVKDWSETKSLDDKVELLRAKRGG
jgi:hypothetical protein